MHRRVALVVSALVAFLPVTVPATAAAPAPVQTFAWPTTGSLPIQGHGSGHGHGLSQYGAYGAALRGLDAAHILAFYYPGTTASTITEPTLRVWIQEDDSVLELVPRPGLRAVTADGTVTLPTTLASTAVTRWRAARVSTGIHVQGLTGSTWRTLPIGGRTEHAGSVDFAATGPVRVVLGSVLRDYRGSVRAAPTGAAPGQRTVVLTSVRDYLDSVVPSEMPASWSAAALQAQAVAARTYALFDRAGKPAGATYDTCDSTNCQVFSGSAEYTANGTLTRSFEVASSNAAVAATAGQVRTYQGALAFTQFGASDGGFTADGGQPYLRAVADPYDGVVASSAHSWTDTILTSTVQAAFPAVGTLTSATVTRDGNGEWGGRITSVVLHGTQGSATVDGDTFRAITELRSTWWAPVNAGWSAYAYLDGVGDWNGDRHDDLIAQDTSGQLWLLPGTGGAALQTRRLIGWGLAGFNALVSVGDWDGDGHGDLVERRTSDGTWWLLPGTGTGGFRARREIGVGVSRFDLLIGAGDFDGDGHPDLIARRHADGALYLYSGTGTGRFRSVRLIGTGLGGYDTVIGIGDWDGDGHPDLIARRHTDATLWLYPGTGTGALRPRRQIGAGWAGFRLLSGAHDLDGDRHNDLVGVGTANSAYLYPGTGTGGFGPRSLIGTP